MLEWLQKWYLENCDGDWEHCYGIKIGTLDNPGWSIDIDIIDSDLEDKKFTEISIQRSEYDWIYCNVVNSTFRGRGGPKNLEELIRTFRDWVG